MKLNSENSERKENANTSREGNAVHRGLALLAGAFLVSAVALGLPGAGYAQTIPNACTMPSFGGPIPMPAGVGPTSIAVGDLNRDGRLDLAVAGFESSGLPSSEIRIFLGHGNGRFTPAGSFVAHATEGLTIADVNRDGIPDLIAVRPGPGEVSALLGDGGGSFGGAVTIASTADFGPDFGPAISDTGDLNRDGTVEVVLYSGTSDQVVVVPGNGDGTFGAPFAVPVGDGPVDGAVADFNRDGILDVALAIINESSVGILLGDGGGGFGSYAQFASGGVLPHSIVVGDFNRDGIADLAVANTFETGTPVPGNIAIHLGDGTGAFAAPIVTEGIAAGVSGGAIFPGNATLAPGDYNNDGKLDLAVSEIENDDVVVLLGDGNGGFSSLRRFLAGDGPATLSAGDYNNDGKTDLAVGARNTHVMSILLNTCPN